MPDKTNDLRPHRIIKNKSISLLVLGMAVACAVIFRDFLTMKKVYLYWDIGSDSLNTFYPKLVHLAKYIKENGIPAWTFSQGLGQNIFPFWLSELFPNGLLLFLDESLIPFGLVWMEIIKIFLCGLLFYGYLRELKLNELSAGLHAFLYAFCGYVILGSCWTIFSLEAVLAAALLYGFERWLQRRKWLLLVVSLMLISLLSPFLLYIYAIFMATYIPLRFSDLHQGDWKPFPQFIAYTFLLSLLGVAAGSYQLLPDVLQFIESPRGSGGASLATILKSQPLWGLANEQLRSSIIFRAFGSDLIGTGSDYKGWFNYLESPLFYCGLFCLVAAPHIYQTFKNIRQKICYGIFTFIWFLPLLFPYVRYTFWGFSGDYFRSLSLLITIILLVFSAISTNHIITAKTINRKLLFTTSALLIIVLFTPPDTLRSGINQDLRTIVTLLLIIYTFLLLLITSSFQIDKKFIIISILALCGTEIIVFSNVTVNHRKIVTSTDLVEKKIYNDYTVDAIKFIKESDRNFFRVSKDYGSSPVGTSLNDGKVQNYYGTTSYSSFNQNNYIRFLDRTEIIDASQEMQTRWAFRLETRPLLLSLTGTKYFLTKQPDNYSFDNYGFQKIATTGDVHIFKNRFALPLGFTYDKIVTESNFMKAASWQKDLALLQGCIVDDQDLSLQSLPSFQLSALALQANPDLTPTFSERAKGGMILTNFTENSISGQVETTGPGILFLSIPFDKGWKARVNGEVAEIHRVNLGFIGIALPAGKHTIGLDFTPRLKHLGTMISLFSILLIVVLWWRRSRV